MIGGWHTVRLKIILGMQLSNCSPLCRQGARYFEIQMTFPHISLTCMLPRCVQGLLESSSIRRELAGFVLKSCCCLEYWVQNSYRNDKKTYILLHKIYSFYFFVSV